MSGTLLLTPHSPRLAPPLPTPHSALHYVAYHTPTDASDFLYQFDSSRDYDPSSPLAQIVAPALFINSADDAVNPPELKLAEQYAAMMPNTKFVLLPITPDTRGHGTHSLPKIWGARLSELMKALKER